MARPRKNATPPAASLAERLRSALVPEEEQPYPVPANWCWVRLGTLITAFKEKTDNFFVKNLQYIGLENIEKDGKIMTSVSANNLKSLKNVFRKDQILYGRLRPYLNKHGIPTFDGVCSTDILVFDNTKFSLNKFVNYYFDLSFFIDYAVANCKGINLPRVSEETILKAPALLPPLAEQQRIVERIEALFAKLDEARAKLEEIRDGHETRRAAILHKAFTGELTAKWREEHGVGLESWEERSREGLFSYVTSGSRGWAKYYSNSGSIFLRMGNLKHGTINIDMSEIQYVNVPTDAEGMRTRVQDGDVLISITADVGMIGFMKKVESDIYINQHIALARPAQKHTGEFISWCLVSDIGSKQLQDKQRGATKVGLSLEDIRSLALRLPTLPEQQEIVRLLDSLLAREDRTHKAATQALEHIDLMKKAILARAFRGKLGTNVAGERGMMGEG